MAKGEREGRALAAADALAEAVVAGDGSRAQALVADSADSGLAQLMASLRSPVAHSVAPLGEAAGAEVQVLLQFVDQVPTPSGGTSQATLRFLCTVAVSDEGAKITAIYRAP